MDQTTTNLKLPYIAPSQAQKHVTHNEAIRALDALVQLSVVRQGATEPPVEPLGRRPVHRRRPQTVVPWAGKDEPAGSRGRMWRLGLFSQPQEGWHAWVIETRQSFVVFNRKGWGRN